MYIKGHVKMVHIKDQNNAIVYAMLFVDTINMKIKACICIQCYVVNTVDTGVTLSHNTVYRVMRCENCTLLCIKWPLAPVKREGYLKSFPSFGFSCSPVR